MADVNSTLRFELRIRDLVHGYVYLTETEQRIIDDPLFQRLRYIRQNDVAFYVFPSLNISRFEHSLGTCHVAGKMCSNVINGAHWKEYKRLLEGSESDFEQSCRLYALLHDVGHLPLSHLFELAFDDFAEEQYPGKTLEEICSEWFGGSGFQKLHEASSYLIAQIILKRCKIKKWIRETVLALMKSKKVDGILRPIKQLIDFDIDADRIDSTARDGKLAGGEYGSYDIDRICSSVFFLRHKLSQKWGIAFSYKAIGSLEALLLDRYRTHTWIHFHHRVSAMKASARILIRRLLKSGIITKESFPIQDSSKLNEMVFRDDVWLWNILRTQPESVWGTESEQLALNTLLHRETSNVHSLWKNRVEFMEAIQVCKDYGNLTSIPYDRFKREYERSISKELGREVLVLFNKFKAMDNKVVTLTDERGNSDGGELQKRSYIVHDLYNIWKGEPQFNLIIYGGSPDRKKCLKTWAQHTANYLS